MTERIHYVLYPLTSSVALHLWPWNRTVMRSLQCIATQQILRLLLQQLVWIKTWINFPVNASHHDLRGEGALYMTVLSPSPVIYKFNEQDFNFFNTLFRTETIFLQFKGNSSPNIIPCYPWNTKISFDVSQKYFQYLVSQYRISYVQLIAFFFLRQSRSNIISVLVGSYYIYV